MKSIRSLLSQNPMTFNELLDLFEEYVSGVCEQIHKGHNMLREEIGGGRHIALGYIFGVECDSEEIAQRLKQIRIDRNSGSDVSLTLPMIEARSLEHAVHEIDRMFTHAAVAFRFLADRATPAMEADDELGDMMAIAMMSFANRALTDVDDREFAILRSFIRKLNKAAKYQPADAGVEDEGERPSTATQPTEEVSRVAAKLAAGDQPQRRTEAKAK